MKPLVSSRAISNSVLALEGALLKLKGGDPTSGVLSLVERRKGRPMSTDPNLDSSPDDIDIPLETRVIVLEQALAEAETQAAQAKDAQLRAAAELENTRRRLERDAQNSARFGAENLLKELLTVADSLDLGLKATEKPEADTQSLADGMALTQRQLVALLEKQGVTAVDPHGEPFNPELHQAMSMVESLDVAANHVLAVMQKGYQLHGRLLRPAMVIVAKAPTTPTPPDAS